MYLILGKCQPIDPAVSVAKRRSCVTKSEKNAIGSHLIQVANYNGPRKFNFHFLNFHIALLNPIFRFDLVPALSEGFLRDPLKYRFMVDKTKSKMCWFLSLLSCLYCNSYLGQGNATWDDFYCWQERILEFTWFLAAFWIWEAAVTTFTTGKIWI